MVANPKYLPEDEPPGRRQLAELEAELTDALDVLVQRYEPISEIHHQLAVSPDPGPAPELARAIALASYRRQGPAEAKRLQEVLAAARLVRILERAEEPEDVEPWTADSMAEYLAGPPESSAISREELDGWLADIYRARRSQLL